MLVAWLGRLIARIVAIVTDPPGIGRQHRSPVRRVAFLLAAMTVLLLLPLHLSPHGARVVTGWLTAIAVVAALSALAVVRRVLRRLADCEPVTVFGRQVAVVERPVRVFESTMALVRRGGVAVPALAFFCGWALVNMLIWAHSPEACSTDATAPCSGAFIGAGHHPTFGDFLFYATNLAFANPPPDLVAHSRLAHAAATIEVLSGVGLVTLFAGAFFGLGRPTTPAPGDDAPPTMAPTRT
jgi:hypothetical protein